MLNKTRKLITGTVLSLSAAALLLLFYATQAMATDISAGATANFVGTTGSALNSENGATNANVHMNAGAGGVDTFAWTLLNAGTMNIGAITATASEAGDTVDIIIADGQHATHVIVNSTITGTTATFSNAASNLDIRIGKVHATAAVASLTLEGNVDSGTDIAVGGTSTMVLGDGSAMTYAGNIDMSFEAATTTVLDLKAGTVAVTGDIDLSTVGVAVSATIEMAEASSITGSIIDTVNATLLTVNVNGSATIGGGTSVFDTATTTAAAIAIDQNMTLTLAGTGAVTGASATAMVFTLTGTGSVLKVTGAKTITGAITSGGAGTDGTLDIDADTTITGLIGATKLLAITVADSTALTVTGNTSATTITLGSTSTGGGTLSTAGAITLVAATNGSGVGYGTLDINHNVTHTGIIGGTKLGLIDIAASTTLAASAAVSSTSVLFSGDGALTMVADAVLTAAVTATTGDQGTITFAPTANDATIVVGDLGTSEKSLKVVTLGGDGSADTATVNGSIYAVTVNITGNHADAEVDMSANKDITATNLIFTDEHTINLATGSDITAAITTTGGANEGEINVAGISKITGEICLTGTVCKLIDLTGTASDLTVSGGVHATTTTIAAGAELHYTGTGTVVHTGILTAEGSASVIDVGVALVDVSGATALPAASILKVTIGTTNGQLDASGSGITSATNAIVTPVIVGKVTSGTAITIIKDNDTSAKPATAALVDNYERYSFVLAVDGNNITLTPTIVTPTGVGTAGLAVNAVAEVAFAVDTTLLGALNGLSGAVLDKALISLAPVVDGGAIVGAVSAGAASGATISTQMASLRSGIAAGQGLNAGDGTAAEERFWTQGFGTYAQQDIREKIAGFTSTTGGVAFGVDQRVSDDLVLGVAYSFSHTNVNSSESKNETKVMSHQATLYGSHDLDRSVFQADGVFLDGQFSYASNDYDGERNIDVGAVSRRADSSYDGSQLSTKFDLGRTIKLDDGFRFTPTAGFSYTHVSIDSYSETNAGVSNLKLQDQDYDMLNLNLKGKIARTWQVDGVDLTPEIHLGYTYETIQDKIQTLSSFEGGGDAFASTGFEPASSTVLGGIGVTWGGDSLPVDMTLTYDAAHKEDFTSHSALVKGVWRF